MGTALALGLLRNQLLTPADLTACARSETSRNRFLAAFAPATPQWTSDPVQLVQSSEIILLAIKPQQMAEILPSLASVAPGKLFLSVAAGISLAQLESWLGSGARVVRAMPNTPSLVGEGMSAFCSGSRATSDDRTLIQKILTSVGKTVEVPENQINAVTALSGSGPAYCFHFLNALIDGGITEGLSPETARLLAIQTLRGSTALVDSTGESPLALAAQVKSPGGTTFAGCAALEAGAFEKTVQSAVKAASKRADELSQGSPK